MFEQDLRDAAADGPAADERNVQRFGHTIRSNLLSKDSVTLEQFAPKNIRAEAIVEAIAAFALDLRDLSSYSRPAVGFNRYTRRRDRTMQPQFQRRIVISAILLVILAAVGGCRKQSASDYVVIQPVGDELEIHALANDDDDMEAIDTAREFFAKAATDEKIRAEMDKLAATNEPPPPPKPEPGFDFVVKGVGAIYRWSPLSSYRLRTVGLEPTVTPGSAGEALFNRLAEARKTGTCCVIDAIAEGGQRTASIWWTRERVNSRSFEYFQLVRVDPEESRIRAEEITIEYIRGDRSNDKLTIWGRFDPAGTTKFADLTRRNSPTQHRGASTIGSLAMLVKGRILASPTVTEPIPNGRFIISFSDDQKEVDDLIAAMQER